ncbi:DedA family protein [Rubrobacter taiwanensis]|jgi:membrane-associated protein|uniref:DedA family protein n=1 Tax=Rubrobacter taiwanensis TaxID=185139 RepID=A0A4R1BM65_9ACTN|nr:DedA family protein [Rubrobacter taiwanensis]TCJ18436.1 DedA family protein [Rubrobacter taiwanensis]
MTPTALPSLPDSPQELLRFLTELMLNYKYLIVFLGAALDFFLPNSGDLAMLSGGLFSHTPHVDLGLVILAGALGAIVSDNTMYWTGRLGGRRFVLRMLHKRLPRRWRAPARFKWIERRVRTHGGKMILTGRLIPGFRGSLPLCAGVMRISYRRFLAFDLLAISIWATLLSTIGYLFGQYWDTILTVLRSAGPAVLALALLLALGYAAVRRRRNRRQVK